MATDPSTLTDPQKLRNLAKNARDRGHQDLAFACMARIAELAGQPFDAAIDREFWQAITVAEELRSLENGKTTRLSRTRQKLARVGVVATVRDLAMASKPSDGFKVLVEGGRPDLTAEAIVIRHPQCFTADVVEAAEKKLKQVGVPSDRITSSALSK